MAYTKGRATDLDPAVTVCYIVSIDGDDLGAFNSCEGLGAEVVLEQREEGGNNGYVWQLPSRIKYPNIKLSRPLTADTEKVAKWFTDSIIGGGAKGTRRTGSITAMTLDGIKVATWGLTGVVPVRWTGPSFNQDSPKVATETVEIAHHGYAVTTKG